LIRYCRGKKRKESELPVIKYKDPERPTKSRGASIMNLFGGYASPRGGRDRDMKRETELITDPMSFAMPRPAPKAPGEPTYSTTQQRLRNKSMSDSDSERAVTMRPGRTLIVSNATDDDISSPDTPPRNPAKAFSPKTPSQDFSQPRPFSDAYTLPSLYEPPTGAPTFRGTTYSVQTDETRPETLMSPTSRYPATDRGSTIGAALGSGRKADGDYWSRQELPPIPHSVSEESQTLRAK
jgi:hypothetical protein